VNGKYRLERWITVVLALLFIIPFVGEAEAFYAQMLTKSQAPVVQQEIEVTTEPTASQTASPLPEDTAANAIDDEFEYESAES
jgi:hypothetical protein